MANMQLTKTPWRSRTPGPEPELPGGGPGYTLEEAMNEAKRCIHCKNPACVSGCPVGIPIPEFLDQVAQGNIAAAYEILSNANALPAISGRVCPQENQCEGKCVRGIKGESVAIGRLERFVADWYRENVNAMPEKAVSNGIKVAVVGSGPAGLTCASDLARRAIRSPFLKRCTPPAACWSTASPSSVCPRPSWPTRSGSWKPRRRGHDQHGHRPGADH